jgi:hypothetical protein
MAYVVRNEVVNTSQITGGVENAVPAHRDIPRIGGRGSDLPCEAVLQEYLQFPYFSYFHWMERTSWVRCGFCELQ